VNENRIYFGYLDIIRFVAAISVVFAHGFEAWSDYYVKFRESPEFYEELFSSNFKYIAKFFSNLGIGVEIFFFISGFLITYILLVEKKNNPNISIPKFFIRRSLRIWPLYFLLLAFGPFLTYWTDQPSIEYPPHIFFYSNFYFIQIEKWPYPFAHFWSIALEEQFYLFWPFIIYLTKINNLKYVFILLLIISLGFRYWVFITIPSTWNLYLNTLSRMDTLIIGGYIALLYYKKQFILNLPNYVLWILSAILIVSLSIDFYASWTTVISALFKKYYYLALYGTIIISIITKPVSEKRKNSISYKFFSYLGKISYGIYMFHNILIIIVIKKILINNQIYSWTIFWITYILMTLILAYISFEFYEKKFLKLKEKFSIVKTRKF
jgi:peptidoglycan/LPS O-acetylase OafA/YrhL